MYLKTVYFINQEPTEYPEDPSLGPMTKSKACSSTSTTFP